MTEPPGSGRGLSPERTLAVLVALVLSAFIGAAVWVIAQAYTGVVAEADARNARLSQRLDEAAGRFFRDQEHAAVHIAGDALKFQAGGETALRRHLVRDHVDLPMTTGIVDARLRVVLVTDERLRPLLEQLIAGTPENFRPPADGGHTSLFVLRPAAESTLPPAPILFVWRVVGPEGGFVVVVTAVNSDQLQTLIAGPVGFGAVSVGLATLEGDLLFQSSEQGRSPDHNAETVTDIVRQALSPDRLREGGFGSYRVALEPDGREGLVTFRRVGRFPVAAVAVVDRDEILRPWRSLIGTGIAVVLGLSLVVVVLAALHIRAVLRSRRALERRVGARTHEQRRAAERLMAAERLTHLGHWEHDLVSGQGHWSDEIYRLLGRAFD